MTSVLQELEEARGLHPAQIQAFLARHTFPIVEGTNVTFVYQGQADGVHLRHWIYGLPSSQPFRRIPATDLWTLSMDLPEGSRMEYKLELALGPHQKLVRDPLNPHTARDPYGSNSVVHGTGYVVPDWTFPDPEARAGTVEEHNVHSTALGEAREIGVYLPPRFRPTRRYPLLVVHDGFDYLRFANLQAVLDNLIHRLEIPEMLVVLTQSPQRMTEYADDERHADFLAQDLLAWCDERYPLVPNRSAKGLLGASFGAVASLAAAWRHPGIFGKLGLQSGSFAFTDIGEHDRGPLFDPIVEFVNAFRAKPGRPADRVFLSCGTYESLIYYNRSIYPLLAATGMDVRFSDVRDGHNWENWRDRLREGLSFLFPGPLWMVYE